ncbi:MAG: hypothetical protein K9H61_10625 [Bacteroidia bacterium]|nr:hypothetical protein [Bacteroidia bacterium]MCF8427938.1 hypothetical protein [Bacteroidia bacterium]MCF8447438.1 hypothetical protein [Bacteroidia bacterium]
MENRAHLNDVHTDLITWVKDLTFYKDEVKTFQNRLEEVVKANNNHDILANVEHFQNQFIRQNEVIDTLKHDMKQVDNEITRNVMENPVASDHRYVANPTAMKEEYDIFIKIYNELKEDFEKFLAKTY